MIWYDASYSYQKYFESNNIFFINTSLNIFTSYKLFNKYNNKINNKLMLNSSAHTNMNIKYMKYS